MDVEENIDAQIPQIQWKEQDVKDEEEHVYEDVHKGIHDKVHEEEEYHTHRAYPSQERTSSHEGPLAWDLDLQESLVEIKLGDSYAKLYEQQVDFDQKYTNRMARMETQLEGIWMHVDPHLPPPSSCPYYRRPPY
ncbi:hypothetical protein Acr_14g0004610 [Actinidia rufa]|uniref:Uncharacterized protein n=1 Tax=Actinidia rufa TaxID=165716 RepID=A0A7J0FQ33_9ERIC|nr:hypothetical protein Acr_14g0004610 [Actinidia rufa]